jgi:transglutaminase-like putative cysteine protease
MEALYLKSTYFFDYNSAEIQNLIEDFVDISEIQKIEQLYLKIRDGWRYNAYNIGLKESHYKASTIFKKNDAHCIDKAILFIAGLRALDIPARLRLAKVSNHIAAERLEAKLGTNELAPHGLVDVFYKGQWKKCSPAFNKELCTMYNVDVLDFNGTEDSILQEFNKANQKFMTYIEDYGYFEDVPIERIRAIFKNHYPEVYKNYEDAENMSF